MVLDIASRKHAMNRGGRSAWRSDNVPATLPLGLIDTSRDVAFRALSDVELGAYPSFVRSS